MTVMTGAPTDHESLAGVAGHETDVQRVLGSVTIRRLVWLPGPSPGTYYV
jgi:hypothetical protein